MNKDNKFDISGIIKIVKSISIDKWLLIGAAGIVLILCSDSFNGNGKEQTKASENTMNYVSEENTEDEYISKMEGRLEDILTSVDGAGRVEVMITLERTETKEILKEEPFTEKRVTEEDGEGGKRDTSDISRGDTVVYQEDKDGSSIPYVVAETSPKVAGVAVVASGGDSPVVKEKITSIIKALFDIEINKIAVGKMK